MWHDEMDGACSTTKEVRNVKAVRFGKTEIENAYSEVRPN
jgi:hypothetical protein